jgi:DB module
VYQCVPLGGIDKTVCCSEKGVPTTCLGICSSSASLQPANLQACVPYFANALLCYGDVTSTTAPMTSAFAIDTIPTDDGGMCIISEL